MRSEKRFEAEWEFGAAGKCWVHNHTRHNIVEEEMIV